MKKFLLGLLVGLVLAGLSLFIIFFAAVRFGQRPPSVSDGSTLIVRISGEMPEKPAVEMPLPLFEGQSAVSVVEYWDLLRKAAADSRVKAVLLMPEGTGAGWGKLRELRDDIAQLKKSGKPVYAFLRSPRARDYYLATAADRIYVAQDDLIDLKGIRAEMVFVKDTLNKLGITMEIEHAGKYKDAGDMFTRNSMTPETREVMNSVVDGIFNEMVNAIAESRKKSPDQVRATIDQGPFLARQAQAAGLVDGLLYEDQVFGELKKKLGQNEIKKLAYRDYLKVPADSLGIEGKKKIALLIAQGTITKGGEGTGFGDEGITSTGLVREIRRIGSDSSIRGVILRVDSPGGDGIASDEILREMKLLSQKKPVVISMSDLAASGGYFIAMTGDPVVAYPNTLTGSIGVIYGKPVLKGLYDKIGVQKEFIVRGRFAEIDSDYTPLTEAGRAKLRESLDEFYKSFVSRVAEGRKRPYAQMEPLAQGRVWLGSQAKDRALIDELGGIDRSIQLVKQKANIGAGEQIKLVVYPPKRSLFDTLFSRSTEALLESRVRAMTGGVDLDLWSRGGIMRVMPYQIKVY